MTDTRSDDEVRAEDQARVGTDTVEARAIDLGRSAGVRNRRNPPQGAKRAESRGIYRDNDGRRRVVGAGQVIPDGWERIEAATVEDRIDSATSLEDGETAGERPEGEPAKPKRSRSR